RLQMREEGARDRAHPRGEQDRVLAPLQRGELLLDGGDRRVAVARIEVVGRIALRGFGQCGGGGEEERGGRVDLVPGGPSPAGGALLPGGDGGGPGAEPALAAHPRREAPWLCSGRKLFNSSSLIWILRSALIRVSSARRRRSASRERSVSRISVFWASKALGSALVLLTTRKRTKPPGTETGGPVWPLG